MAKTQQKITEAMFFLLHTKDFNDITVEQICQITELSRTTFYRYFDDKYDIILQYTKNTLLKSPEKLFSQEILIQYLDSFKIENSWNRILIRLIKVDSNSELKVKIYKIYNEHYDRYYRKNTVWSTESDAIAKMMSEYTCSAVIRLINWWIDEDFSMPAKVLAQFISYMIETSILFPATVMTKD